MEELRDERLSKIVSWMQAYIRGYLTRKDYKKLQEQRLALVVVQRNLRKYLQLRTWPWWKLWQKIKPLLNVTRIEDEMAVSVLPRIPASTRSLSFKKMRRDTRSASSSSIVASEFRGVSLCAIDDRTVSEESGNDTFPLYFPL